MTTANFTVPPSPLTMASFAAFINTCLAAVGQLQAVAEGINFNSANTDTAVEINLPTGYTRYLVEGVSISGASQSLSSSTLGVFTAAGGGGVAVAANQAVTVTSSSQDTNNNAQALTLTNAGTTAFSDATLYVRVGTAQGSAATGNVVVEYKPLP